METHGIDPNNVHVNPLRTDSQASMPSPAAIGAEVLDGLRADILQFHQRGACNSGHDLRRIIGTVRKFTTGIREGALPQNIEAATPREVSTVLSEIGRSIFLPRHEVLDVRLLGGRYEIVTGKLEPRSYKSEPYLGREIKTADITFSHGIENSMGLSIDNLAMIDPRLIRLDCTLFLEQLPMLSQVNPFARELRNFIVAKRITKQDYCNVAGLERLLKEEVQHAKDAIFIDLITKGESGSSFKRRDDVLLKPGSWLHQMLRFDTPESILGSLALSEYSSSVGGLVMELKQYLSKQQYDDAKLAVLDFLTQQASRAMPPRDGSISTIYHIGALAVFEGLRQMIPDGKDAGGLVSGLFAGSTPQQQAQRCRKVFSELHDRDLLPDWERKKMLAAHT